MIEFDDLKEDSIETMFCVPFSKLQQQPLNGDVNRILIILLLQPESVDKISKDLENEFMFKLIKKRIEVMYNYQLTNDALVFMVVLSKSPGNAVMYLTYLQYYAWKNKLQIIDLKTICEDVFPFGTPSEADLEALWRQTKIHNKPGMSDNLVDIPECLKSIRF